MNETPLRMSGGEITQAKTLDFSEAHGPTRIAGDVTEGRKTECLNLDLRDSSNLFPSSIDDDTLEDVLTRGNSAGSNSIDMNNQSITNALLLGASNAQIGTAQTPGICSIVGNLNANTMQGRNINLNNSTLDPSAVLQFTGLSGSGQTTEIKGDETKTNDVTNCTKCSFLDLTDSSNILPPPTEERFEWGATWTNAQTIFPPPPYQDGHNVQIPTINQVYFDFKEDDHPGFRYFAPQSDSDCQIDPDDHMGLHEGDYIHASSNLTAWQYAFYAVTAATTISAHASQIVEFTFPVTQYGYGRIYACLAYQPVGSTDLPLVLNQSFRLIMEHESTALATNPRLNGPITVKWFLKDVFPTNGTQWKIYPMIRTDDNQHYGRMQVIIGDGQPLFGCNPGDPPEFDPQNTNAQNGQLILRGYPLPATFYEFPNPS
jgi:hypothetical protein